MRFFTPEKIAKIEKSLKELSEVYAQLEKYKVKPSYELLKHNREVKLEERMFN